MKESTIKLLAMDQRNYLSRVLESREYFKSIGKKYITVERDFFYEDEYRVYLTDTLERGHFDLEIVEYIEL